MSIQLQFMWSHLNYFPKNYGDLREEQRDRLHQYIYIMNERYQGFKMFVNNC